MAGLQIARIRGVPVRVHWTFWLLLGLVGFGIYSGSGSLKVALYAVGMFIGIFLFVLVHELAHVAAARRFGVATKEITLHPLGGISMMESVPEKPKQEAIVAVVGPLVNVVAAILLIPFVVHFHGAPSLLAPRLLNLENPTLALDLFWLNILMGAFNLLPAFPLDGGRVLRASMAIRMPYAKATRIAANLGRFFGIFLALAGIIYNFWFILIGIFVYFGASAEERMANTMTVFAAATVRQAMRTDFYTVRSDISTRELMDMRHQTGQLDVPVVDDGVFMGMVDRTRVQLEGEQAGVNVAALMDRDPPSLAADEDLGTAFRRFASGKHKALPVLAASAAPRHLIGVVTVEDMERAFLVLRHQKNHDAWVGGARTVDDARVVETQLADRQANPAPEPRPAGPAPAVKGTRVHRDDGSSDGAETWYPVGR